MELYIRIKDGQPFKHPILGDNFCQAFPDVDVNNLPPEFARFERVERPMLSEYETLVSETSTYELIDGVYKDVWHKRDMTLEEKEAKKQVQIKALQDFWAALPQAENWSTWVLNVVKPIVISSSSNSSPFSLILLTCSLNPLMVLSIQSDIEPLLSTTKW